MMKRTRLVVAAAAAIALAATGTASAAPGPSPAPGSGKPGPVATGADGKSKVEGKAEGGSKTAGADLVAAATALGVTVGRLEEAFTAAKTSLASLPSVTQDDFITAVATELGLPVARVRDAVQPLIGAPGPGGPPAKDDDPQGSPFLSDAAAAFLAADLGVGQAQARTALAELVAAAAASGGIDPQSPAFGDIAASLGVSPERLRLALRELKASLYR